MRQINQSVVADRTGKRLLAFQHRVRRQSLDRFTDSQHHRAYLLQLGGRDRARWLGLLTRAAVRLFEDLGRYLDLCLARILVWREIRRRRKQDEMISRLESDDESRKGLASLRRRLRKRESERFVAERGSVGAPAAKLGFTAVWLGPLKLNGNQIVSHFLSPILELLLKFRGTGA